MKQVDHQTVLETPSSVPMKHSAILEAILGPPKGRYHGRIPSRKLDSVLQGLKKTGQARYLKKGDGGPGWVR